MNKASFKKKKEKEKRNVFLTSVLIINTQGCCSLAFLLPWEQGPEVCPLECLGPAWSANPKPFSAQTKHFSEPAAHREALSLTPGPKEKAHLFT